MNPTPTEFIFHIISRGVQPEIQIHNINSPSWVQEFGVSWRSTNQTITAAKGGETLHLKLRNATGDDREIEWNPKSNLVKLCRTELWSRPFYFSLQEGELLLSDSLRLILSILPKQPEIDHQALDTYLALEFFPAPLTPFRDIFKVGVEESCQLDLSTQTKKWIPGPLPKRQPANFDESVEEVHGALCDAIDKHQKRCPDELVLMCSGGLDSTILAHCMHGQGRAVFLAYINSWKDETQRAHQTAEYANLSLMETRLPVFDTERFYQYAGFLDEPLGGTCGYAMRHLCSVVPQGSWIVTGHGTGTLSLMNFKHRDLGKSLDAGPLETLEDRFSQRVCYLDRAIRQRLLPLNPEALNPDPINRMLERELPYQEDKLKALHALIRRQLCVTEETSQLWAIYNAFGHTPVMPFFEHDVRKRMDRLPENILRDENYSRRFLEKIANRHCPGYQPPQRQLGYGLPLGLADYPNDENMRETVDSLSNGPFNQAGLMWLLQSAKKTSGVEKFFWLRRLWSAILLHAWLDQYAGT